MQARKLRVIGAVSAAALSALPLVASAQTSANWTFNGDGSWSENAKWNPNAFPDGGGVATFNMHPLHAALRNIVLDVPVTLGGMNFNSSYQWQIPNTLANTITLNGAANINVVTSNTSSPSVFQAGDIIFRPIAGSNGLTKSGAGVLTLSATNTYTGGTTINGGVLRITSGNNALGATGAGNNITLNGGTLRWLTTTLLTARAINLGASGTLEALAVGTFNGVISGGDLNKTLTSGIAFDAANTYNGVTNLQARGTLDQSVAAAGIATFENNGTALNTTAITSGGTIVLDNTNTNINGRLNPSAPITLHGAGIQVNGNAAADTVEAVGAVSATAGQTFFTVAPNALRSTKLTIPSVTPSSVNTQVYRGTNLGQTLAPGVGNIFLTTPPALVGGGGAAGTTNISIIPTAIGTNIVTGTGSTGTDLVTYGPNGVRPLNPGAGEYASIATANPTDNVLVTSATAATIGFTGNKTVNALVISASATFVSADTVTVTSGMVLINSSAFPTHSFGLNFGSTQGIINTTNFVTMAGPISGTGGVVKAGSNAAMSGSSTFSGPFILTGGTIDLSADVHVNQPSPFGSSADPIILQPGSTGCGIDLPNTASPTATIDRDIIVRGLGSAGATITNSVLGNGSVTLNGNITLERQFNLASTTVNGLIQGIGRLQTSGPVVLNHSNSYSGGTNIGAASRIFVGNDNALGTGTIYTSGTGAGAAGTGTIGAVGGLRTIANPLVILGNFGVGSDIFAGAPNNITFTGDVNLSGGNAGSADAASIFTVPGGLTATFTNTIHDGGISKAGGGKLVLSGNNTYTGGTSVTAGILQIDNASGSGTGSNFVNITAGGTLAGIGTITGPTTIDGTSALSPGDSPGTLHTAALALANTSSLLFDLGTAGVVDSGVNDLVAVNGNLTLDGVLTMNPQAGFGFGSYTIFTYTGTLTDNGVTVNPVGGFTGTVDTSTPGVVLLNVVPEPGGLGILALASTALLRRRSRGKSK